MNFRLKKVLSAFLTVILVLSVCVMPVVADESTELVNQDDKWYYYVDGVMSTETALVKHGDEWIYIVDGEWDPDFTNLIKYSDEWFLVTNGKWDSFVTTLFKKNGKYLAIKSGKWFKGNAIIDYSGKSFYVKDGFAQLDFSGDVKIGELTYTIKGGKVQYSRINKYAEFIKYRGQDLKNTYAKLSKGEEVNVLYYGGSVTNGTGASNAEKYSWRALVGNWLTEQFPQATVNNINVSYGGTGSYFGAYRLNHDVIPQEPDLIFIEFAINDHYDNQVRSMSYEMSSKHFETIVHGLRTALPECDIVTVLTTEKGYITTNQRGELHTHAQAHEDISIAYNVPSLHIGRALVSKLSYSDITGDWNEYMTDIVHPTDEGYALYFEVFEEYLSNCLLRGGYDGNVMNHTLPRQVNEYLVDGDMQYIPATRELITQSYNLGGRSFYYSDTTKLRGYSGGAEAEGSNASFTFEFTGTEVAVLKSGNTISEFQVIVDGKSSFVKCYDIYPEILVTGLTSGKHTLTVKPVYENGATTGEFFIMGFFVRDESKSSAKYDHKVHTFKKYVSNKDATCKRDGTKTAKCSVDGCDKTDTVTDTGSRLEHKFVIKATKKATTSKNGTGEKVCAYCDRYEDTVVIKYAKTFKLSASSYHYNGKVKKPTVTVKDSAGKTISSKYYTVTYNKATTVGKHRIKVTLKGNYSGTKYLYYTINPPKSAILKLTPYSKKLKVSIQKQSSQTGGYEIQYSTSKSFKSAKTVKLAGYKTVVKTLTGLKAKTTYYVRVRTYKWLNGKKYVSSWSTAKYKKTK